MPDEFQTLKKERCIEIIKACNGSGMPKRQWCREHGISYSTFMRWQRSLRNELAGKIMVTQAVVPAASFPLYACSGSHDSKRRHLHQHARSKQRYGYSHRPRTVIMLGDITQAKNVYNVCGRTDMRKGIRGLTALVQQNYQMDPTDSSLFLFCGKSRSQLKALLWEPDGFILLSKQLSNGRYQWPRTAAEVQKLTWEQFTWLMQGLSVEQPKAIRPSPPKKLV